MNNRDVSLSLIPTDSEKRRLLSLSREVLRCRLSDQPLPDPRATGLREELKEQQVGLFVTLRKRGDLRGCIGTIETDQPLVRTVFKVTQEAALQDYRFPPVTLPELPEITIEHSLLSRPQPVQSYREIRLGTDGIILKAHGRSAVFLPEVPTQQGWTIEQTLTALSRKAGVGPSAWNEPTASFTVFQTIHYCEE